MFGFEALNTAIEELVDRVSPELSQTGKHAKDLGSFAVFCMLVAAGLYIAWVVFT
jgi:diacylglycerol kinase (ATP)